MGEAFQPKLIYLTRRNASLSREAFTARWREHGRLGMSMPSWSNIARYVHCDVLEPRADERHLLDDYDGIGMIWHKSAEQRAAHIADKSSWGAMKADEADTFDRPIVETSLVLRETVLEPPSTNAAVTLVRFVFDGSAAKSPRGSFGHSRNHPLAPETGSSWGLDCQLIEEFWFHTREGAVEAAAELKLKGGAIFVVSNEALLYFSASAFGGGAAVDG